MNCFKFVIFEKTSGMLPLKSFFEAKKYSNDSKSPTYSPIVPVSRLFLNRRYFRNFKLDNVCGTEPEI